MKRKQKKIINDNEVDEILIGQITPNAKKRKNFQLGDQTMETNWNLPEISVDFQGF